MFHSKHCWKNMIEHILLVTDHYNKMEQCSEFKDNRHDQSILSLVRKKHGSIVLPDETYF